MAARKAEPPAEPIMTGMLGVGIVPFVDRRHARERERVKQDDAHRDYNDLVDRIRAEMAEPPR
jgi:hypothetical protein